jgi:hypothetical protein
MLVSSSQALALVLHGVGQALMARSAALEGHGRMHHTSTLFKEALQVSQAFLAVQIALVTFRSWRLVVLGVTLLNTLYFAALAAVIISNSQNIGFLTLSGVFLMAIGSLLFGFVSRSQRHQRHTQLQLSELQRHPTESYGSSSHSEHGTIAQTADTSSAQHTTHLQKQDSTKQASPFEGALLMPPSRPSLTLTEPITLPTAPTAEMVAQIAYCIKKSASFPRDTTPSTSTIQTVLPFRESGGGAPLGGRRSSDRVLTAFTTDPYKVDVHGLPIPHNNEVFSPGYFESGRQEMRHRRRAPTSTGTPSASSSMEIVEENIFQSSSFLESFSSFSFFSCFAFLFNSSSSHSSGSTYGSSS